MIKIYTYLLITATAIIAIYSYGPIHQDPAYHNFADQQNILGVCNFFDVLSNIVFLFPGLWGTIVSLRNYRDSKDPLLLSYFVFFLGIILTSIGSSYYHLSPSNDTLVWDRLPMTLAFMPLLCIIISEQVHRKAGLALLLPAIIIGTASVFYWQLTDDLSPYILVQFLPLLLMPLMLFLHPARPNFRVNIMLLIGGYGLSKVLEFADAQVYELTENIVSGHTLKHIVAGLSIIFVIKVLPQLQQNQGCAILKKQENRTKIKCKHRILIRSIIITVGLYMLCGCTSLLFYHPDHKVYGSPSDSSLAYEDVWFNSSDGTKLHGWFVPATTDKVLGTVIHYHGNAQNLSSHFSYSSWLPEKGYNVFIFDYRGYGQSEGTAGKKGIHQDSVSALSYVLSRPDVSEGELIVLGQSLGGTTALAAINELQPVKLQAIILDSTFLSYQDIVRDKIKLMPIISLIRHPLSWLISNNSNSAKDTITAAAAIPLLIFHDKGDQIIPYSHSEKLYKIASDPKKLKLVNYGYHTSALSHSAEQQEILNWLDALKQYN